MYVLSGIGFLNGCIWVTVKRLLNSYQVSILASVLNATVFELNS